MNPTLVAAPVDLPVTLSQAKAHLRVDASDEDALITALIEAATAHLDGWDGILGRALMPQTWEMSLDRFPVREIRLPLGPLVEVVSVTYADADGVTQTVAAEDYEIDPNPVEAWIVPNTDWPSTMDTINAVTVRWIAGAGCPKPARQAILLLVGHWYAHREAVNAGTVAVLPLAVEALLSPLRRVFV
jgi:uncharacterized phiE125 gp8 family phage protein